MAKKKGNRKRNTAAGKQGAAAVRTEAVHSAAAGSEAAERAAAADRTGAAVHSAPAGPEAAGRTAAEEDRVFTERLSRHHDELRWLYMELYGNSDMFAELCDQMKRYYDSRKESLKALDLKREKEGKWYRSRDMVGMMMYIDNFAGNLKGVQEKLPYLEKCNVNYIHLMPFLDSPKGRSDGGYAVADFRKVKPELGTMDDLAELADKCHEKGISLCMDFVMNHTSEDHEWAVKARHGIREDRAPGISDNSAGEFYLAAGDRTLRDDYILSVPVGSELPQPESV